ncbi:MAG: sodium:calcium antiporter [SAR202 cluster bacterium]|nr:sodium:calcium antiporter [SAR202 cluster bacterium]
MGGDLAIAIAVFLGSAGVVMFCGTKLAVYGDALASLTGWGRLFVGSLLIALATSLPELSTNISAVQLDPPNPQLAVGNVFGANMLNMFTMSAVVLAFGGKRFLVRVAPEQGYLIVLAAALTGAAVLFGGLKWGVEVWEIGLSSIVLVVIFVVGMWWVYKTRPNTDDGEENDPGMSLRKAWLMFGLVSLGVVFSGFFLAWSTDEIAGITGIASSTLGILLVSLVTTMPEASSTIAAARMGAADLGMAGLYGSCAFNVTILFYADIFYRGGILGNQTEPAHFVAGGVAVGLMLGGLVLVLARKRVTSAIAAVALALMAGVYIAGAIAVAAVGATEGEEENAVTQMAAMTAGIPGE